MKKQSGNGSGCELSIRGDELERHRIQLEHNLMHTDLSLHLSSGPDDHHSSVEYPRHNSGPFADFASFENPSGDNFDPDNHSHLHAWSYRTMDEEGISPYAGETVSTAAHHASALTLSAGLAGRRVRRDVSLSGAEYDPDRPLHDMMAGVDSKLSVFDVDLSKSRHMSSSSVVFDPLIVDSSTELDRVLQSGLSGLPGSRSVRLRSSDSSASSSASESESSIPTGSRPKLSDALRSVSFSPKRPHSAQSSHPAHPQSHSQLSAPNNNIDAHYLPAVSSSQRTPSSPLAHPPSDVNAPTTKPRSRRNIRPSCVSTQPEVRLQPPTPPSVGSQFTKIAKGLAREIEVEQSRWEIDTGGGSGAVNVLRKAGTSFDSKSKPKLERNPFSDIANQPTEPIRQRRASTKSSRTKVHLPDVTGLTSAVESPAKPASKHYMYRANDGPRETEARLLSTLTAVQSKLIHLESENSISRRRVRELELELETCKREVAREKTRVMEREEVIVQQQRDVDRANATRKGKSRVLEVEEQANERYAEVLEEKKALEALIATLRAHLTRLTAELSSHQHLLTELRSLRESDSRDLKEKSLEVDKLRKQVERLAGEVEVLRGVVEEGLKESRLVREHHSQSHAGGENPVRDHNEPRGAEASAEENESETMESEGGDVRERQSSPSLVSTSQRNGALHDRTTRTDYATLGSSNVAGTTTRRFIDSEALERISVEVEERRSDHSGSVLSSSRSQQISNSRSRSPSQIHFHPPSPDGQVRSGHDRIELVNESHEGNNISPSLSGSEAQDIQPSSSRPPAMTPAQVSGRRSSRAFLTEQRVAVETPFPQIRGSHLERLFFSAPEHNAKTCAVCHRRRPESPPFAREQTAFWFTRQKHDFRPRAENASAEDDEGFVEGSEGEDREHISPSAKSKGKQREQVDVANLKGHAEKGLPPQTVLAKVLRELEDDFTHYKGIYVELADQYKTMDAVSDVPKRNILAQHLREVIDILELKGDQIASLYDLLAFNDKPVSESVVPPKQTRPNQVAHPSWGRGRKHHCSPDAHIYI